MKTLTISRAGAAALGLLVAAVAASPAAACSARLQAVQSDWHAMSFAPPMKPSQARVVGRDGREMTAGQYNYIHGQIRQAHRDCQAGQVARAAQRAAHAHGALARAAGRGADAPERFAASTDAWRFAE